MIFKDKITKAFKKQLAKRKLSNEEAKDIPFIQFEDDLTDQYKKTF